MLARQKLRPLAEAASVHAEIADAKAELAIHQATVGVLQAKARAAVSAAVRARKVNRPDCCPSCRKTNGYTLHFHHTHGYAPENWFTGEWLCPACHTQRHSGDGERPGQRLARVMKRLSDYASPVCRWLPTEDKGPSAMLVGGALYADDRFFLVSVWPHEELVRRWQHSYLTEQEARECARKLILEKVRILRQDAERLEALLRLGPPTAD